jgi:hypothetical protein
MARRDVTWALPVMGGGQFPGAAVVTRDGLTGVYRGLFQYRNQCPLGCPFPSFDLLILDSLPPGPDGFQIAQRRGRAEIVSPR